MKKSKLVALISLITTNAVCLAATTFAWFIGNQQVNSGPISGITASYKGQNLDYDLFKFHYDETRRDGEGQRYNRGAIEFNDYDSVFVDQNEFTPLIMRVNLTTADISSENKVRITISHNSELDGGDDALSSYMSSIMTLKSTVDLSIPSSNYQLTAEEQTQYKSLDDYIYRRALSVFQGVSEEKKFVTADIEEDRVEYNDVQCPISYGTGHTSIPSGTVLTSTTPANQTTTGNYIYKNGSKYEYYSCYSGSTVKKKSSSASTSSSLAAGYYVIQPYSGSSYYVSASGSSLNCSTLSSSQLNNLSSEYIWYWDGTNLKNTSTNSYFTFPLTRNGSLSMNSSSANNTKITLSYQSGKGYVMKSNSFKSGTSTYYNYASYSSGSITSYASTRTQTGNQYCFQFYPVNEETPIETSTPQIVYGLDPESGYFTISDNQTISADCQSVTLTKETLIPGHVSYKKEDVSFEVTIPAEADKNNLVVYIFLNYDPTLINLYIKQQGLSLSTHNIAIANDLTTISLG